MKKFALVIIAIIVAFSSVYPPDVAHANLVSKPIGIAAKKAAKTVVKDTAVEMANQIVSEFLVRELIEGVKTDEGYSPVCMDGKKDSIKDCPPDKRAQVKTKLSSTDKSKLEKTVESVLEKKTNTSSKWGKFLDIFIPLFLVSGAIEIISASLDGDILSFFDEIAQDALVDSGLLKPLFVPPPEGTVEQLDFSKHVQSVEIKAVEGVDDLRSMYFTFDILLMPNVNLGFSAMDNQGNLVETSSKTSLSLRVYFETTPILIGLQSPNPYYLAEAYGVEGLIGPFGSMSFNKPPVVWRGGTPHYVINNNFPAHQGAPASEAKSYLMSYWGARYADPSVNNRMNTLLAMMSTNPSAGFKFSNVNTNLPPPEVKTDYGKQTATDKIKDANGNVPLKGMQSFTFTYGDTHIYPSDQSTTGWKDKTTGEDITVVEDDVVVDDGSGPTDPTDPGGTDDPPDKDKTKEQLEDESKKLGNLVTTRFPFSLPWDFVAMVKLLYAKPMTPKWEVKGTEEIPLNFTINLNFLDPYISWFRGFIMVGFVISVIFMHGRFMGGSK